MKSQEATRAFNLLFQQHIPRDYAVVTDRQNHAIGIAPAYDSSLACHTFAISSPTAWESCHQLNSDYNEIGFQGIINNQQPNLNNRTNNMNTVANLRGAGETVLLVNDMQLCGGFGRGDLLPEHMWIEDRTNDIAYDTFINRNRIEHTAHAGVDGNPFQPACESGAFPANSIVRVQVAGYTWGQLLSIAASNHNPRFPQGIATLAPVQAAIACVDEINNMPQNTNRALQLTRQEQEVVDRVMLAQSRIQVPASRNAEEMNNNRKAVVANLTENDKRLWDSALEKDKQVAAQQRNAACEIANRHLNNFLQPAADQRKCVIL